MPLLKKLRDFFKKKSPRQVRRQKDDNAIPLGTKLSSGPSFKFSFYDESEDQEFWLESKSDSDRCAEFLRDHLDCTKVEKLGSGAFGIVMGCTPKRPEQHSIDPSSKVACKAYYFDWRRADGDQGAGHRMFSYRQEVKMFKLKFNHPNIVKTFSMFACLEPIGGKRELLLNQQDPGVIESTSLRFAGFFMERVSMDLRDYFLSFHPEPMPEKERKQVFLQIGTALEYLHREYYLCHNDIKQDNIGVIRGEPNQYKLFDFGCSLRSDKRTYDVYALGMGSYAQNPFDIESVRFGRHILNLAAPEYDPSLGPVSRQQQLDTEIIYRDDGFRETLEAMIRPNNYNRLNIIQALKRVN